MRVLNVVTKQNARFYQQQVAILERMGVEQTTLAVPGDHADGDPRSPADYLRFYPRVFSHALRDYDLVHANYGLTAPLALAQPRLPVVLTLWGTDVYGQFERVSRLCSDSCAATVVMSEAMADRLGRACHVIPHGVDLDKFRPRPKAEARAEVGWDPEGTHVLFPYGTDRAVKDYPRAERVVEAAADRRGGPIELQTVTGVPHDGMPAYVNAADALLLTSKWEGSPNSVKEALACDRPVVATPVGDVPERLRDVDGGYVCETDRELVDGLLAALDDGTSDGREHVRPLSLERMGHRLLVIYEDVVR